MSGGELDLVAREAAGGGWRRPTHLPIPFAGLRAEIEERISRVTTRLNDYGFAAWKSVPTNPLTISEVSLAGEFLSR